MISLDKDMNVVVNGSVVENLVFFEEPNPKQTIGKLKKCVICNKEFKSMHKKGLDICSRHSLKIKCKNNECDNLIPIRELDKAPACSRSCNIKSYKQKGECSICGKMNEVRDQNSRGRSDCNCSKEWYNKHNSSKEMIEQAKKQGKSNVAKMECEKHGLTTHISGKCITCHNQSEKMVEQAKRQGVISVKKAGKYSIGFCSKCNKDTFKNGFGKCMLEKEGIEVHFCDKCDKNTPFKDNKCTIHDLKTYKFIDNDSIIVKTNQMDLLGLSTPPAIHAIYSIYVNDKCIYIGCSKNVKKRMSTHCSNIIAYPEMFNYNKGDKLEVKILEELDDNITKKDSFEKELKWIDELKPWSQRSKDKDSYDRIIDIDSREDL